LAKKSSELNVLNGQFFQLKEIFINITQELNDFNINPEALNEEVLAL